MGRALQAGEQEAGTFIWRVVNVVLKFASTSSIRAAALLPMVCRTQQTVHVIHVFGQYPSFSGMVTILSHCTELLLLFSHVMHCASMPILLQFTMCWNSQVN
jgi:hypothetical protein